MNVHKIICGHVIPALKTLPDEYVDTLMTSVPYWGLRDYGKDTATIWGGDEDCEHDFSIEAVLIRPGSGSRESAQVGATKSGVQNVRRVESTFCSKCGAWHGQLGLEPTPEFYIEHLRMVFVEVKRVLKNTGTCWVNIGDSYAGSSKGIGSYPDPKWEKARIDDMKHKTDWDGINLPAKCLCMIPERFLMMMVLDLGFILRNKNIWKKDNPMPSSVKDRFNNVWEPVYFFTKNNKPVYWYNDKTGLMVGRKPTSQIEGVDWDWKEVGIVDGNTFNVRVRDTKLDRFFIKVTEKEKESYGKLKLKKVSHWHSVDYWFDLDAVREPWTDIRRAEEGHKGYPGKYGSGYNAEYRDKLPGQGIKGQPVGNPDSGKNPGDVFYNTKYATEEGQTTQESVRQQSLVKERQQSRADAKILFPHDKKQQQDYINFIHDHTGHPLGANPGDFWAINTQPFPGAHFAVFPGKLCEKPILAGCPAEVCKHCGMARVRITKPSEEYEKFLGASWHDHNKTKSLSHGQRKDDMRGHRTTADYETTGWTDCQCENEDKYQPGVILDPFGGSGTVSIEAAKLGRSSIYIDIKKDYCEMALKWLKPLAEQTKLSGEQSKVIRIGF